MRLMIGHILAKYLNINIVTSILFFSFKARPCFAFEKVEKAMSDSSGSSKRETKEC